MKRQGGRRAGAPQLTYSGTARRVDRHGVLGCRHSVGSFDSSPSSTICRVQAPSVLGASYKVSCSKRVHSFPQGFCRPPVAFHCVSNMCRVRRSIRTANDEDSVLSAPDRCSLTPIVLENEDAAPALGQVPRSVKQVLHDLARVLARQAAREDYAAEQTTEGTSPCASPSMPGSALTSRTPDR